MKILGTTHVSKESEGGQNNSGFNLNASGTKNSFGLTQDPKQQSQFSKVEKEVNQFDLEVEKLGRYWIWENYCDDDFKNKVIEDAVEMLKHINKAVHQDIEDSCIR